jgi:hypothetical protein
MARFKNFIPHGVIPATLLALHDDFSIDESGTRRHLRDVAAVPGLAGITVNGHASEVHACTLEEQACILDVTLEEIGDRLPVISGVWADGSAQAARIARLAEQRGAAGLSVRRVLHGRAVAAGNGHRAFLHDRGGDRSAADRIRLRRAEHAVLSTRNTGGAGGGGADHSRDQGLEQ